MSAFEETNANSQQPAVHDVSVLLQLTCIMLCGIRVIFFGKSLKGGKTWQRQVEQSLVFVNEGGLEEKHLHARKRDARVRYRFTELCPLADKSRFKICKAHSKNGLYGTGVSTPLPAEKSPGCFSKQLLTPFLKAKHFHSSGKYLAGWGFLTSTL